VLFLPDKSRRPIRCRDLLLIRRLHPATFALKTAICPRRADDTVTVPSSSISNSVQGPNTGLATLVAEELTPTWSQMRAESAPANDELYGQFLVRIAGGAGGSTADGETLSADAQAGAAARAMLVDAARRGMGRAPRPRLPVSKGGFLKRQGHRSGLWCPFAEKAATTEAPAEPKVEAGKGFYTGSGPIVPSWNTSQRRPARRIHRWMCYRDGMETVVWPIRQMGAVVASFDDTDALKVPGVIAVREIPARRCV